MKYYQYVAEQAGLQGKVKLAQITNIPSSKAAIDPDTQDAIQKFKEAVSQITGKPAPSF
jgi:hypothetical protein